MGRIYKLSAVFARVHNSTINTDDDQADRESTFLFDLLTQRWETSSCKAGTYPEHIRSWLLGTEMAHHGGW